MTECDVAGIKGEGVMPKLGIDRISKLKRMQTTLRLATCSELRRDIFIALQAGKKALRELRDELSVSSTTAIHALRELEKDNLIFQDGDRDYALTKIGGVIALKLSDFVDAIDVLKKHEEFWLTHDLSGIPPHLLEKIGALRGSSLLKIDALQLPHDEFINLLCQSKWVKGISPIYFSDYAMRLNELINVHCDVQLILTVDVLNKFIDSIGLDDLKNGISQGNLQMSLTKEEVNVAFTVADNFVSLGLFRLDGTYDLTVDLISHDREAINWGIKLFEYYQQKADKKVTNLF
jgi:predicted transcriptional regulator